MANNESAGSSLVCSNCGALNQPHIRICSGCGADQVLFRAAHAQLRALQDERADEHDAQLQVAASETVEHGLSEGRRYFASQFRQLLVATVVCVILTLLGTAYYAHRLQVRRDRLILEFGEAKLCLQRAAYVCARDGFAAVVSEKPDYPEAQQWLRDARIGVAREHTQAARWEEAIAELDAIVQDDPNDNQALAAMQDVYDRWYKDALGRGEFMTALSIKLQRDARFP